MTPYWNGALSGFCWCGLFMSTIVFLAARRKGAGQPLPSPHAAIKRWRLKRKIVMGIEQHRAHRGAWRLDPDDIYRCPECDPHPLRNKLTP